MESPWMQVKDLAKYLKLSKETVYRWLESETVPCFRVGKLWYFHKDEIDEWIFSQQQDQNLGDKD